MEVINKNGKVTLFESPIRIDYRLPKYKEEIKSIEETNGKPSNKNISYDELREFFANKKRDLRDFNIFVSDKIKDKLLNQNRNMNNFLSFPDNDESGVIPILTMVERPTLKERIINFFTKPKKKETKEKEETIQFDVLKFFSDVKLSLEQSKEVYKERISEYVTYFGYTEKLGQTALKEKLFDELAIKRYESVLYACDFYKVLTEEKLIEFAKGCDKDLHITYLENYIRNIPMDIADLKIKADELEVFDNYVILHYDPEGTSTSLTKEEIEERRRDPILFGVISGSRKLYYIGDWIDEYCDLTFDTLVEHFGQNIIEKDYLRATIKPC